MSKTNACTGMLITEVKCKNGLTVRRQPLPMDVDLNSTNVLFMIGEREWCLGIRTDLFVRHKVETMYLANTGREAHFEHSIAALPQISVTHSVLIFYVLLRCRRIATVTCFSTLCVDHQCKVGCFLQRCPACAESFDLPTMTVKSGPHHWSMALFVELPY